jgi:membrane-associated phospholipid phosphatase
MRIGLWYLCGASALLAMGSLPAAAQGVTAQDLTAEHLFVAPAFSGEPAPQAETPPPVPEHTGLAALFYQTGADFKAFPRRRSTWVFLAVAGGAAALVHPADDSLNAHLAGRNVGRFFTPGKYIGSTWAHAGTAIGLYTIGRYVLPHGDGESRSNKVSHLGFDLLRTLIVSESLTYGIKYSVHRDRPTGDCCSFPSGHATTTFAAASVIERHLGLRGAVPTYLIASYVAASRLHENVHFLSDVVFGAGLGIASGWTVVGRHGRSDFSMMPVPTHGGAMIVFTRNPTAASAD